MTDEKDYIKIAVEIDRYARGLLRRWTADPSTLTPEQEENLLPLVEFAREALTLPEERRRRIAAEEALEAARAAHREEKGSADRRNAAAARALGLARAGKKGASFSHTHLLQAAVRARIRSPEGPLAPWWDVFDDIAPEVGISPDYCRQQLREIRSDLKKMLKDPSRPDWQTFELEWHLRILADIPPRAKNMRT